MPIDGISDDEIKQRVKNATELARKAVAADKRARRTAQEATRDAENVSEAVLRRYVDWLNGDDDWDPKDLGEILETCERAAADVRKAAEELHEAVLHPAPAGLNVQMLAAAAEAALRDNDLVRAYNLAGTVIAGCERALRAADAVEAAERALDEAASESP